MEKKKTNDPAVLPSGAEAVKEAVTLKLSRYFGVTPQEATESQAYKAVVLTVKDMLISGRSAFHNEIKRQSCKRVYYMCMEFLLGRQLRNNLMNLGIAEEYREALKQLGFDLDAMYEHEPDPGLGNGGLGRLAACYLDSLTTLDYPAYGYSLLYEYGFFRQKLVDGTQVELPDTWMPEGDVWLVPRTDKSCTVRFGGHIREEWKDDRCDITLEDAEEVLAVPYDLMISGDASVGGHAVNILRLWKAQTPPNFNMKLFSQGQYVQAMQQQTNAEIISKVLYPSDNHTEGKMLRLTQQYFLVSASLQTIIADHLAKYGTMSNFSEKVSIHLNDTHPALCIPELMRILMDVYSYGWDDAWRMCVETFSYTNHTVLPEALEQWNEDIFRLRLPRIYMIVCEINRRWCARLWDLYPGDWDRISRMAVIGNGNVRMANLSVVGSNCVNGVSALHTDILKKTIFHDQYRMEPQKFINITNGVTPRRWMYQSNPRLTSLIDGLIGDGWHKDCTGLSALSGFASDKSVLDEAGRIKLDNKRDFSAYVKDRTGITLSPDVIFDVQAKRMHEYKRQLLNALRIISLYNRLKDDPSADVRPKAFIFGAKAAQGYYMAKEIIRLLWNLSAEIEKDKDVREKLRVIFLEDYNVSLAEKLIPATDIDEQISLAGKEASGTGNMKFMFSGAVTIGTLDGANVEMFERLGDENIMIFGLNTGEVEDLWKRGYDASSYYHSNETLRAAVDRLSFGFNGSSFEHISRYLISGSGGIADPFMCLADFESYCSAHDRLDAMYDDRTRWERMSLMNTASAGYFSSDRSIKEYADRIWHIKPVKKGVR